MAETKQTAKVEERLDSGREMDMGEGGRGGRPRKSSW